MLYGIGCDLCEIAHLEKSLTGAHAAAFIRRVYGEAERAALSLDEPLPAGRSAAHRLASAAALVQRLSPGPPGGLPPIRLPVRRLILPPKRHSSRRQARGLPRRSPCVRSRLSGWKAVHLPIIFPARRRNGCRPMALPPGSL